MIKSTMHNVQFYKTMIFEKGKGREESQNRRPNHDIDNKDTKI